MLGRNRSRLRCAGLFVDEEFAWHDVRVRFGAPHDDRDDLVAGDRQVVDEVVRRDRVQGVTLAA